jgi:hypothetical protein
MAGTTSPASQSRNSFASAAPAALGLPDAMRKRFTPLRVRKTELPGARGGQPSLLEIAEWSSFSVSYAGTPIFVTSAPVPVVAP